MSDWKNFSLGDVCSTISETYRRKSERVTLINTSDVLNGKVLNHDSVPNKNLKGQFKKTFQREDILFSEIRPINRRFAFVDFEDTQDYIASTKLMVLRPNREKILPRYLYFFLSAENVLRELQHLAETRSGTFPQITFDSELAPFPIKLPPLETQKKIAAVLGALDDKIELNNAINKNLEEQAQAIYKKMFVEDFNPAWRNGTLGEFVEIKRGSSPRPIQNYLSDKGLRWLKISDVTSLSSPYVLNVKEHIKEAGLGKTIFLTAGSLVLSNSATPGIPKILDVDTCIHDGWLYFPESKFSKEFLYLYFKHIKNHLINLGNGSVFTNLKIDIVKSFPVNLSDERTLSHFDGIIIPLFASMKNIAHENQKLGEIRDALLPRLMNGEIDVSAVEI